MLINEQRKLVLEYLSDALSILGGDFYLLTLVGSHAITWPLYLHSAPNILKYY